MGFKAGDKVLIGGNLIATISAYDADADRLVYVHDLAGGGTDTVYAHISNTRLEEVAGEDYSDVEAPVVEAPVEAVTEGESDASND